jgi:hypothetical protein
MNRFFYWIGLFTTLLSCWLYAAEPVALYSVQEESLELTHSAANPFAEIDLELDVRAPARRQPQARFAWFGFYDGDGQGGQTGNVWKFRLMLDVPGEWNVTAVFRDSATGQELAPAQSFAYSVAAKAAPGHCGHITRDPQNPMRLAFADGTPWVPFPLHSSFLLDHENAMRSQWIREHAARGVNALGVRFHAEAANALGVAGNWQFLAADGSRVTRWPETGANGFDYARPDLAGWRYYEEGLDLAERNGIYLHIWFGMSGDNRQYHSYGPQDWIQDGELGPQQKRFIRYFLARWAALPVWWHWTVDSEYEEGPGDDLARDRAWAAEFQQLNPWPTLITTHVLRQWTPSTAPEYDLATLQLRVPQDPSRIVSDSVGFVEQTLGFGLPVFNAEGVWSLRTVEDSRIATLAHYFAGGFSHVAHTEDSSDKGHHASSWGCEWDNVNPRHKDDADMLGQLSRFFNAPEQAAFNRAHPAHDLVTLAGGHHALCLADPGRFYAVWLDEGGTASLDLSDAPSPSRSHVTTEIVCKRPPQNSTRCKAAGPSPCPPPLEPAMVKTPSIYCAPWTGPRSP